MKNPFNNRRIILVEDSVSDAKLTHYALSQLTPAPELLHFSNGEELFAFIDEGNLEYVYLILLDLNLPKMSGLDILRELRMRASCCRLPIVIFSSSDNEVDIIASYQQGANAYVQKPLTLDDFDQALTSIVEFWSRINVAPSGMQTGVHA